jgi:dihydrofolate reductase
VTRLRVNCFSVSLDGFGAGSGQTLEQPLGANGLALHEWMIRTRTFQATQGETGDETGVDDDFVTRGFAGIGAWIMGRNMFGPIRGPWNDEEWKGWWGENPPYHCPVYVLTNHSRSSIEMEGGTTFHFVTSGIDDALEQATRAADAADIRLGGGVNTIRQYLSAGLVDELHVVIVPVLIGSGEALLAGLDLPRLGYRVSEHVATPAATHVVMTHS